MEPMKAAILAQLGTPWSAAMTKRGKAFTEAENRLFEDVVAVIHEHYRDRLISLQLFGSRARGTGMDRSDYDFIAFLDHCEYDEELPWLENLSYELTLKHGLGVISLSPMSFEQFNRIDRKYPGIVDNIKNDSIRLWPGDRQHAVSSAF